VKLNIRSMVVAAGLSLIVQAAKGEIIDLTCTPGPPRIAINTDDDMIFYQGNKYANDHTAMLPDGRPIHIKFTLEQNIVNVTIDDLAMNGQAIGRTQIEINRENGSYTRTNIFFNIVDGKKTSEIRQTFSGSCVPTKL